MDFAKIPPGTPEEFNVVIEIPRGSSNKYELDEATDTFALDFVFSGGLTFIADYGFVPGTKGGDGDTLDAYVITPQPLEQGLVVKCRAAGLLETLDRGEVDNKVIAVPLVGGSGEPKIPTLEEFRIFYTEVARQKNKTMEVIALHGPERAIEELRSAIK